MAKSNKINTNELVLIICVIALITGLPILFHINNLSFDPAMYTTEWFKTVAIAIALYFLLKLFEEKQKQKKADDRKYHIIELLFKQELINCLNQLKKVQTDSDETAKKQFIIHWQNILLKTSVDEVNRYINDPISAKKISDIYASLNGFINTNQFLKQKIDLSRFDEITNDDYKNINSIISNISNKL